MFSLLPIAVASAVGALYTVGAVLTTAQLRTADLAVRDTLPLVPLPQLLGRGMSVFLKSFAGIVVIAVVFAAALFFSEQVEQELLAATRRRWPGARRRVKLTLVAGVAAILALLSEPAIAVGVAGCSFVLLLWVFGSVRLRRALLVWAGLVAVVLLVVAFYRPEPLPTAELLTGRGCVEGDLITVAADTWYVGRRDRRFVAVSGADVRSAGVFSAPHTRSPLFRLLLNNLKGQAGPTAARLKKGCRDLDTLTTRRRAPAEP